MKHKSHTHCCSCGKHHEHTHHPECLCHAQHSESVCTCGGHDASTCSDGGDDGGGEDGSCGCVQSACGCGHDHTSGMKLRIIRLVCGVALLICGGVSGIVPLIIAAYIIFGYDVILSSMKNITKGRIFDENFLMTIATIGAFVIGEYIEGAAVMLFYQIGETLSDLAVARSRKSISALMDIRPDTAVVQRNGGFEAVSPESVEIGEIVLVKAGERIPVDGTVTEGECYLDCSPLTGEAVPVHATPGKAVQSGCINNDGTLYIRADKKYADSTASRILRLVESTEKSKSERFITRFAAVYTPIVVFIALAIAVIMPLVTDGTFAQWGYRALIFLVVSCPCALVVSIPLTFFAGIGSASRNGILIKGSDVIERLANVKTVIFDKTGTLTHGVFDVVKICGDKDALRLAAYAEYYSNHPVSSAVKRSYDADTDNAQINGYTELAGMGVRAMVGGNEVLCGNEKLMDRYGVEYDKADHGGTVIYVAECGKYVGSILISDIVKETSAKAVAELGELGIDTVMLTGDERTAAEKTAMQLGIGSVYSQLMPDDKVRICKEISVQSGAAFAGDGINDAPVLAGADVGFAMGALGSDAAIEAADAVIMNDDPQKTVAAIKIARRTNAIAKQNIVISIAIKVGVMLLGVLGIATMWTAVFADVGVMLLAVCNALRALKK